MKAFCIKTLLVIPLLVSAVLTGTVLAPTLAHARVYDPGFLPCAIGDRPFTDDEGKKWCDTEPAADENAATNAATTEPAEGGNIVSDIVDAGVNILARPAIAAVLGPFAIAAFGILTLSSVFLWLAGVVFNWAVQVLVFQFAVYLGNTTGMLTAWGILRDFGNIILLFGFVYMGIQTILQIGHYSVGRALSRLVIFAVLLNFSLFIAEAVIDTANVLASTVYNQTYASSPAGARCQGTLECGINDGIASVVLNHAGVGSVLTQNNSLLGELGNYVSNPLGTMVKYLLLAFLMFTAAIVLFAGAFMLISRGIFLAFLMVTSPIGFAGMAVPWLEKMAKDWWDKLIQQALFAPVFLILLFVGLKLMEGMRSISGGGTLASAVTAGGTLNTGPILVFVLVIGFMIAALLAANKFGIYGSEAVTKFSTGAIGRVAGAGTLGVAGWVGRRTVGSGAAALGRSLRAGTLKDIGAIPILGRGLVAGTDMAAKASFDARSTLKTGVDLGAPSKAAKGGRLGEIEAGKKANEEYKKSMVEADKQRYELAEQRFKQLEEKLGPTAAAAIVASGVGTTADEKELIKQKQIMSDTIYGTKKNETDAKEKFDENIGELKELGNKLDKIDASIKSTTNERDARHTTNPADPQIAVLDAKIAELEDDKRSTEAELGTGMTEYRRLRDQIRLLRQTISTKESQYRKNVEGAAQANVLGLSPLDRRALREAALAMKKDPLESKFEPKNLDDALGKALKRQLTSRGITP